MTTPPAPPPATDTPTVCKNVGTTLKGGWPPFQATLEQAKTQLSQRNLNGTEASLKQGGQQLNALGAQVKQDGSQASDANLKNTVTTLGTQLTSLGGSLNSLSSLKSFNPGQLAPTSKQLSSICKGNLAGVPLPG
jgi:small-conductance mechanosensitive channel